MSPKNQFLFYRLYITSECISLLLLLLLTKISMGGIPTKYTGEVLTVDAEGNDKVVSGLYAAGEAACVSVHGANRLGANSLLDIVVFGRACANHIKENLTPGKAHKPMRDDLGKESIDELDRIRNSSGPLSTAQIRLNMQKTMQTDAAVFRTQETLNEGVQKMNDIYKSYDQVGIKDRSMIWNSFVASYHLQFEVSHDV